MKVRKITATFCRPPLQFLVFSLLPGPTNSLDKISLGDLLAAREVPSSYLGIDLDTRVGGNEMICEARHERGGKM
jgi:hypothetical protein